VVDGPSGVGLHDERRVIELDGCGTAAARRSCLSERIGIDGGAQRAALCDSVDRFDVVPLRSENESLN
jgi:hypothetical protein